MRLDAYLTSAGLTVSRAKAKEMIELGAVTVNGMAVLKPAYDVSPEDRVQVRKNPLQRYVGRGGLKLEAALSAFSVDPAGQTCLDVGASSGGFTDCLLQHGAAFVYAVDSGEGQLHPSLAANPRVCSMEKTNARYLTVAQFPRTVTLAVMDVSFISQTLLLPVVAALLPPGGTLLSLIKPQFELGRAALGKNGVVKDARLREKAVGSVVNAAALYGFSAMVPIRSPIEGGDGNVEYLACFRKERAEEGGKNP